VRDRRRLAQAGVLALLVLLCASEVVAPATGASGLSAPASGGFSMSVGEIMSAARTALAHGTDPSGVRTPCSVGDSSGGAACGSAAATAGSTQLSYPTHRWGAEITYDASDGYPLLYGGQDDTWAFEDGTWVNLAPKVVPAIVSFACLTYDWKDGYVLLFGGGRGGIGTPDLDRDLSWTFHAGVWTNITNPSNAPPGLQYPSCTYDAAPGDGYVVMFGGADATGPGTTGGSGPKIDSSNQTWTFRGGVWTNITNYGAPHPSARFGAAMAYDASADEVVLYGGAVNGTSTALGSCTSVECPHLNDTWTFVGGHWSNISVAASAAGTPPGRWEAGFANDSADGYLVIFGGQANGYKSYNATANYTWAFDNGVWKNLTSSLPTSPQSRFGEAMGYDPATRSVLMFSGLNSTRGAAVLWENTWSFANGQWTQLSYFMNFTETGLPNGSTWNVTVTPPVGPATDAASNSSLLELGWATGSFGYSVGEVPKYRVVTGGATGTVSPSEPTVALGFGPYVYTVKFSETGLHGSWKASWSVTMNGTTHATTGTSISIRGLVPGSYSYQIGPVANYSLNRSYTGTVSVSATGTTSLAGTVALRWTLLTYRITFRESGLPAGTPWEVTLDGKTHTSTSHTLAFSVSNGSYAFTVSASGYDPVPASGTIDVDGSAVTQTIAFALASELGGPAARRA
jgi:hypothetical protein